MKMSYIAAVLVVVIIVVVGLFNARRIFSAEISRATGQDDSSLYDLQCFTLAGESADLGQFRGQVALVVNTASECGLTPQYAGLESLHREFNGKDFLVLGFPSNDFMGQEPGDSQQIANFCSENYQISFPLFAKSKVKGDERCEVYRLLSAELAQPTWNFTKYLVAKDGRVVARFGPKLEPDHQELRKIIEEELAQDWNPKTTTE